MAWRGSELAVALVLAVAVAGCGTREEGVVIADPVAEALAHAPADAAALAVVATDPAEGPGASLAALVRRFAGNELLAASLTDRVGLTPEELRPLLGRPVVLWTPDGDPARRFAAWVVADGDRLGDLLRAREGASRLRPEEAVGGYETWTRRGGGAYARRGPLLVTAPDLPALRDVLARRADGRGQWTPALLEERGLGLPRGAVARVLVSAPALLARRGGSRAPRVPWVAALERVAVTATPLGGGLRLHARASTDAGRLAPNDVPLAPGVDPPVTRGSAAIVAAVRDPRQTLRFARRAADLLDATALDGLRRAEAVLARYARVSVEEDLVDHLTGTATITSSDGRTATIRAELDDPGRTSDALERLGTIARFGGPLADLTGVDLGGLGVEAAGPGYALTQDGRLVVALAVIDGALVASTTPGADLVAAARAPAAPAAPTAGAFRATVAAGLFRARVVAWLGLPSLVAGAFAPLGAPVIAARGERERFDVQVVLPIAP